jgi:hypothetical protein
VNDHVLDRNARRPARLRLRPTAPFSVLRQMATTRELIDGSRNAALADFSSLAR